MQFARIVVFAGFSVLAFSQARAVSPKLIPMDEPVTTLTSPASANPAIPAFQYNFGANPVATLVTANPLLCANTATATGTNPTGIIPVYYSANGSTGATPMPFVFGATASPWTTSAVAYGASNLVYNGSQVQFGGDPLDALVCYGLDANGVHKVTRDLFADGFEDPSLEGLLANSTVTLSVLRVPGVKGYNGNEYDYYIDAFLPNMSNCGSLDCNFVLMEGYDTSLFNTSSGQWCQDDGSNSSNPGQCNGSWNSGDINLQTTTGTPKLVAGHNYFAVRRFTNGLLSLPSGLAAVVALFSPLDLQENKLDDNVATGDNTLSNMAPSVVNDSALAAFRTDVAKLQENTDSTVSNSNVALTFNIADQDSSESAGHLLTASVTLNLPGGIRVPIDAQNCDSSSTNYQTAPVSRTCTIDIPLNSATFWNASVAAQYQGQFNNVATDTTNGTYASGVSASIQIVVTDAQGKNSALVSEPVHIFSTKNDAPVVTFDANQLPAAPDSYDSNNSHPTWSCSIASSTCGTLAGRYLINLPAAATAFPGPVAAFDELAAQMTSVVAYTGAGVNGGNVQCVLESGSIFVANGNPIVSPANGSSSNYDNSFQLTNPPTQGSALCTLTITDAESPGFPNSELAATTAPVFRIVVGP